MSKLQNKRKESSWSLKQKILNLWSKFIFAPDSLYKMKWDMIIILLSIWNSIEIPYEFAFPQDEHHGRVWAPFEVLIDCLFGLDIIVNFRSIYKDPKTDELISDTKLIS